MRVTVGELREMKQRGETITMFAAYDFSLARLLDESGADILLVGDSLGGLILGRKSKASVTLEDMIHHTGAVARGAKRALVVGDMPFLTYHTSIEEAVRNAGRYLQEAGAPAVKLEGGVRMAETVRRIVECGIPVMGHIGRTPQSANESGQRFVGTTVSSAMDVIADAEALEGAGVFALVLDDVAPPVAKIITSRARVPTISVRSGPHCDGQAETIYYLLGLAPDYGPRHAKRYGNLGEVVRGAVRDHVAEVRSGAFPAVKTDFVMDCAVLAEVEERLKQGRVSR